MARKETYKDDSLPLAAVWVAIPPSLFLSSTCCSCCPSFYSSRNKQTTDGAISCDLVWFALLSKIYNIGVY